MIDNPVSWFILLVCVVAAVCVFLQKVDAEISRNRAENDDFFWRKEWQEKYNNRRF